MSESCALLGLRLHVIWLHNTRCQSVLALCVHMSANNPHIWGVSMALRLHGIQCISSSNMWHHSTSPERNGMASYVTIRCKRELPHSVSPAHILLGMAMVLQGCISKSCISFVPRQAPPLPQDNTPLHPDFTSPEISKPLLMPLWNSFQ